MIDRDLLREKKREECEQKINLLHRQIPRLEDITREIGRLCTLRIRVGILKKNTDEAKKIDQQVELLLKEKKDILQQHNLPETIYEPDWDCNKCQDRGYIRPGVLCDCLIQERLNERFNDSGIKGEMREYTFANFDIKYYQDPVYMGERVHRSIQFVEKLEKKEPQSNLVFLGPVGMGKTHLSVAIANAALANGNTVVYKRSEDLIDIMRQEKFNNGEQHNYQEALGYLKDVDLLVIDDFGSEYNTAFAVSQLQLLIEDRNLFNKPWIINTNLSPQKIQEVYGARLSDRIFEKSVVYRFEGEGSIRQRKRRDGNR